MDFGLHLPLMDFGGHPFTLDHLVRYAETSQELGFSALAANDHLVYSRPWLDGPTAISSCYWYPLRNQMVMETYDLQHGDF